MPAVLEQEGNGGSLGDRRSPGARASTHLFPAQDPSGLQVTPGRGAGSPPSEEDWASLQYSRRGGVS